MPQKTLDQVMIELRLKLRESLLSAPTEFSNSDRTTKTAEEIFPPRLRRKVSDKVTHVIHTMLGRILPNAPPTSRKGQGSDGGTIRKPGGEFDL